MKNFIAMLACCAPLWLSAQEECKTAEDCFQRGVQSLFDKEKLDYQNECFTKAIKLDPKYADAYHYRGGNFARRGKYKEAVSDYTKFIDLASKQPKTSKFVLAKVYFSRAEAKIKLNKKKEALADYKAAMDTFPKEEKYADAYEALKKELGK